MKVQSDKNVIDIDDTAGLGFKFPLGESEERVEGQRFWRPLGNTEEDVALISFV